MVTAVAAPVPILDELVEELMRLRGREVLERLPLLVQEPHLELHRAREVVLLADLDFGCTNTQKEKKS